MDDEEQGGFKWEKAYTESLGINIALQEDEQGSIANSVRRIISESKRQRRSVANNQQVRLGIVLFTI
jgi:hypothetical protein